MPCAFQLNFFQKKMTARQCRVTWVDILTDFTATLALLLTETELPVELPAGTGIIH